MSAHSQVSAPFQVLTHVSTYQHPNKKVHMISIRDVGTCRHLSRCRHFFRCWHMSVHISIQIKKVHMISIRDVGTCRHLDVSAPSQVSALFQVLTHASISKFANKKVHMISMTDVGTCRHLSRCRHFFRCWHIPVCK